MKLFAKDKGQKLFVIIYYSIATIAFCIGGAVHDPGMFVGAAIVAASGYITFMIIHKT